MPNSTAGLEFDFEWRTTLFTLLLLPLMVSLGFWQLQRADEKAALASRFEQRQVQPPALLAELRGQAAEALAYRPVQLRGIFQTERYFLLDNRIKQGRFGYEVLALIELEDGAAVLVNRGWIAGDPARQTLPEVAWPEGVVSLAGHVYVAPGSPYLLAEQQLEPDWPKRIQAVEMGLLGPAILAAGDDALFPYTVRLNSDSTGALAVDWKVVNVSPAKHHGYAVQWFAMAAVLFVFYLLRSSNLWQFLTARNRKV